MKSESECTETCSTSQKNSKQIIAANSGRHIQLDAPEIVIDAIQQMVEVIRNHKRLAS